MDPSNSIESVRKRPGMYVGDTEGGSGIIHLVLEVLGNAFDPRSMVTALTFISGSANTPVISPPP